MTRDGRIFMPVQRSKPDTGMQLGEVRDGALRAYPDDLWNGWKAGDDPTQAFVGVNAIRIGPDGLLWVVDSGIPALTMPRSRAGSRSSSSILPTTA